MVEENKWILDNILGVKGDGFVIRENESTENIETCGGEAVRDEKTRTCEICVALNSTVFRNNNKPEYYHPHCKCVVKEYKLDKVTFDFPMKKVANYLLADEDKKAMMRTMGYIPEDSQEVYDLVKSIVESKFLSGDYILRALDKYGQRFQVDLTLEGKRDHAGESFKCHVGCTAWPYGKIKVATPLVRKKGAKYR